MTKSVRLTQPTQNPELNQVTTTEEVKAQVSKRKRGRCAPVWSFYNEHRTPVILGSALVGFILGFILNAAQASIVITSWIALPGDLFIRALKCIVLPLVFVNVVLAVIQMLEVGQAVSIGWKTVLLYMGTTFIASMEGLIVVMIFKQFFSEGTKDEVKEPIFMFGCQEEGTYITESMDGELSCMMRDGNMNDTNINFLTMDVNGVFQGSGGGIKDDLSISQTLQDGIFRKLVSNNIVGDFVGANFASVITFAIVFAVAAYNVTQNEDGRREGSTLLNFFQEIDDVFIKLINWVIVVTPIAVISLIGGALGQNSDLFQVLADLATMIGATFCGMLLHVLTTHMLLLSYVAKINPFTYLRHLAQAQLFAFACASSAATIPVTTACVKASGQVPETIRDFIIPLGATINMDGGAISFPVAIVFLAVTSGIGDQLNVATFILIIFISAIGSAGAAPIPASGLVLIITAFNTVFDLQGTPATFSSVVAADFIVDRLATALNVTGDMVVCRMVTALTSDEELKILDARRLSQVEEKVEKDATRRMSLYEKEPKAAEFDEVEGSKI